MNKNQVVQVLEKIATYLELQGANSFKISAYRKAAAALENDARSMEEIEDVTALKGIGKGTAAVITELLEHGKSTELEQLQAEVPAGLPPLLKIPGLGGKKIAKLYAELGIDSAEALKKAAEEGKVQQLAGFAKKTEEKILKELETFGKRSETHPVWQLEQVVADIDAILATIEAIECFSVAGSYRRVKESSKDVDYMIASTAALAVKEALLEKVTYAEIVAAGDTKISFILPGEEGPSIDFRIVTPQEYATALHHFTGSKEHNVRLRQIAKDRGEKISEYGVEQQDGSVLTFESEEAFFNHFDLPFMPPTVRAGNAEFERYAEIPKLVTEADIRSDLHMHTTWSDGAHTVEEMGRALMAKGYEYAVITDHSQYLKVANGLTPERLAKQREEILRFNHANPTFNLLRGTEMDILPDGSLDFSDDVLKELDFVIASIHSSFAQPQEQIMERLHNALKNPYVHMIAHPTGRVIHQRDGYNPDMVQLLAWAKKYNKIVELNANPYRLDLCVAHLEMAAEAGVPVAINTDAHAIEQLRYMTIGTKYAQKAWLHKDMIVNTWSFEKFMDFLHTR
ncbi:DNA polymerase/3'-5' exonuclease PolX [Kurthia sibirica]|uniref:DNA polymerase beta n=1 Tax=Kurthia sibirica TaxID=202750 RepID=A0A2U3ANM8_9BACL|nr:DNA polymerase/3'-5' exonuclease PolX [Kurthia sibirica]PWI26150.1 DNA polymerase/3'-5' exonuclease PolX [Kurthia sibirica]GEK33407.1 DNA polymerase/3'-5' exonuclease PolX [Kurthia sibirica]